jgi:three-Cys-motif partner protein
MTGSITIIRATALHAVMVPPDTTKPPLKKINGGLGGWWSALCTKKCPGNFPGGPYRGGGSYPDAAWSSSRVVECHFVEQNPATYRSLRQVLEEVDNGGTLVWEARHGNVAEHLDELLVRAEGVPLFLFLDPFGLGLPFDVIVDIYLHQAPFSVRDTQNLNRIVREFFPKGVTITSDPNYLATVASEINDRPRKIHNWKKPSELFTELVEAHASTA